MTSIHERVLGCTTVMTRRSQSGANRSYEEITNPQLAIAIASRVIVDMVGVASFPSWGDLQKHIFSHSWTFETRILYLPLFLNVFHGLFRNVLRSDNAKSDGGQTFECGPIFYIYIHTK